MPRKIDQYNRHGFAPPDIQAIFNLVPKPCLILDSAFTIVAVNEAYLNATMTTREAIVGHALFEVFPDNPDELLADGVSNLRASLLRVLKSRAVDRMPTQKYDIEKPPSVGMGFEARYWNPVNVPVLGEDGYVKWIIHSVDDVTELVQMRAARSPSTFSAVA
jgi:PAS domain-containing protein